MEDDAAKALKLSNKALLEQRNWDAFDFLVQKKSITIVNTSRADNLMMEMEIEIPSIKATVNSDIVYFFTSAQDGDPLQDDVRLCLADDLKKSQDHNQRRQR
ncbi:hypothetical protein Tco_1509772 [Tanacetum coccineum]